MTMVFIEEADPRNYNNGTWALNSQPPGWVDPFAVFHGEVSYCRSLTVTPRPTSGWSNSTVKAARDSANGIQSFYWSLGDPKANRDFRWVFDRYRYVGWSPLQ